MDPSRARLLVADDSPLQRGYIADLLRREGFEVHSAADGRVALDLCRIIRPDLLILDLEMPRLKGDQVLERLRADRKISTTPVLILTADDNGATLTAALDGGATDFVTKAAPPEELLARIRRALRDKEAVDGLLANNDALVEAATTDVLTRVPNRRASIDALSAATAEARGIGSPLAVAIIDIDEFKLINDHRGHAAGDQVLCAVARRLADAAGSETAIGRWGGDEFIAVVPNAGPEDAAFEAEALRAAIADTPIEIENESIYATVSVGWASSSVALPDELITMADDGLYEAKACGRNCTRRGSA